MACLELGLPELQAHCLATLASGISADSACSTLLSAQSALSVEGEEEEVSVVHQVEQICMECIEANTRAVFKSKGFLQLPKETLLSIIQSSKVFMYYSHLHACVQRVGWGVLCKGLVWNIDFTQSTFCYWTIDHTIGECSKPT